MRTIDEILADMQAIMSKPDGELTADDVLAYQALELELAQVQEAASPDEAEEGEEPAPAPPAVSAQARQRAAAVAAARARHNGYTKVVVPAGRPSNRQREDATQDTAFRNYLRTAKPNADITNLWVSGPENIGSPRNAQGETSGPAGGYLVPEGFRLKIVERMKQIGGMEPQTEQITTETGQILPWPVIDDTANVGQVVEEGAVGTSGNDVAFDFQDLGAYEYQAGGASGNPLKLPWSLMQDAAFDVEKLLARLLGMRLQRAFAPHLITGTGVKQPKGILTGLTPALAAAATTPAYSELLTLITAPDIAYWDNARWVMNQNSLGLVWGIKDSQNRPIWIPGLQSGDMGAAPTKGTLLGYPVTIDNGMPNFLTSGGSTTNWALFGDIQQGYVTRKVRDIAVVVNPWSSASQRQNEYTAWMRADGRPQDTNAYAGMAGKP